MNYSNTAYFLRSQYFFWVQATLASNLKKTKMKENREAKRKSEKKKFNQ